MAFVDRDGRDWYSYNLPLPNTDETQTYLTAYKWTNATSQNELDNLGIKGTYLGKAVVVFDGYYDEKLGEDETLTGKGAKTAKVTVYGPKSADDIAYYTGFTMSSDPSLFGVVDNGIYTVNKTITLGPYDSTWKINYDVPALNNFNPAYPNRNPAYINGVYIHRNNIDGFTGTFYSEEKQRIAGVSEGCLIISSEHWNKFHNQLAGIKTYKMLINRK